MTSSARLNSTAKVSVILLVMMIAAGSVTALWGFIIGNKSLNGVSKPDANPTQKLSGNKQLSESLTEPTFIKEKDVLVKVYNHIYEKNKKSKTPAPQKNKKNQNNDSFIDSSGVEESNRGEFPRSHQDRGVTLEIVKATMKGNSFLLDVNLKNDSSEAVGFLYSFLDVRDEQGTALSAITEGLPEKLPANGEVFSGKISIPSALLDNAKQISLTLTDYPDQKLKLKISEIPVVKE